MRRIIVIDSHTGGEPTRTVISGGPDLGTGLLAERAQRFKDEFDAYRSAICCEPRGSDVLVGALLVEPHEPDCAAGVIFFNNVGVLGMCGHGTIGLVATLAYQGKLEPGLHRIDTPVGPVTATLHANGKVSVANVPSYRKEKARAFTLSSGQAITGDIAWGGNWFFLCSDHGEEIIMSNIKRLTDLSLEIREAVNQEFPEVDHVELFGPPTEPTNDSKNFVLCPGAAYDRSPCGTGTSAKLACLYADGKLQEGQSWRQESITGSVFEGVMGLENRPTITGQAWVNAESTLLLDDTDPLCWGIR
ncbi:MAG: proline racemase family protein [Armatimonas sp.]